MKQNAFVIPPRSCMAGARIQPLKTLKPAQHITVIGVKASQSHQAKTARISRAAI